MEFKAVVLLSGGLDSSTVLAHAVDLHPREPVLALSVAYGQRHGAELQAAKRVAARYPTVTHHVQLLDMTAFGGSALTDHEVDVPDHKDGEGGIPVTYVPGRNTILLALCVSYAERVNARHIYIGVNAVDYSGYPDCRPEFVEAFSTMANLATKKAVEGEDVSIHAPLIDMTKAEIIRFGLGLGVHYEDTVSCYQATADGLACGKCDSCVLRRQGFEALGVEDPTRYVETAT